MRFHLDLEGFENLLPQRVDLAKPVVDLRQCDFIRPDGALGVFLLLRYWVQHGKRPLVYRPENYNVDSYFERTGVPIRTHEDVDYIPDISDVLFRSWTNRSTMNEIVKINNEDEAALVVDKFATILLHQKRDNTIILRLRSAMIESFQNMPQHGNPFSAGDFEGYANFQSYDNRERIVVAAGDIGVGIKNSLKSNNLYHGIIITDMDAINKVVNDAASRIVEEESKSRGGGLQRAIENVKNIRGTTLVRSGTAALFVDPFGRKKEIEGLKYFPGTQVNITILS